MAEDNTERTGAEPEDKTKAESSPAAEKADKKEDSPAKEEPWHKDPRFKNDLGLLKTAKTLMEKNQLDSVDDLVDLIESGKKVKGKQIDLDRLDEIVKREKLLTQYEAYWAEQDEKKRREQEDPEHTIARLEHALKTKSAKEQQREAEKQQAEQAKKAIEGYDNEVKSLIKEMEMPKDQQGFILEFMGVGNPANDIDITDRKAIKRLVADAAKKKEAYDQAVIAAYLKTKDQVPKVGSSSTGAPEPNKPKVYLKDARKALGETMKNMFQGG